MEILRPDKKLIDGFFPLSTSTISDALDRFGLRAGCEGIFPIVSGVKMAGPAFTLRYVPVGQVKGTVGDYIDIAQAGDVIVLDNNGRTDCTVWGDILTSFSHQHNIGGTLIDGVCRDTNRSIELGYPIFSVSHFMRTGKDRVQVDATNIPVSIANVRVRPGDVILGDADGVVVIPKEHEENVLRVAEQIEAAEEEIRKAIAGGMRLVDARVKFHYHDLQHG